MRSVMAQFQDWVESQCDGDCEHGEGVVIAMLDNPGWAVDIDLRDTRWASRALDEVKIDRSEADWLYCRIQDGKYTIRCGVQNLEEGLTQFLTWVK